MKLFTCTSGNISCLGKEFKLETILNVLRTRLPCFWFTCFGTLAWNGQPMKLIKTKTLFFLNLNYFIFSTSYQDMERSNIYATELSFVAYKILNFTNSPHQKKKRKKEGTRSHENSPRMHFHTLHIQLFSYVIKNKSNVQKRKNVTSF